MSRLMLLKSYSPVGDLTVISICIVMMVLLFFSYVSMSRSFRIFLSINGFLVAAALSDVTFFMIASTGAPALIPLAYAMRCLYHACLFMIFLHYVVYIAEVTRLEPVKRRVFETIAAVIFVAVVTIDIVETVQGRGARIEADGLKFQSRDVFMFGYMIFVALIVTLMTIVRTQLYRRVMMGFYGTMAISFLVLFIQGRHGQTSFTVATFLYPVIAMFYILHSKPYDARLGAIDSRALEDTVRYSFEKKRDFIFLSLYLRNFDEEGKILPEDLQAAIRRFSSSYFRGAMLFQAGRGHVLLMFTERRNPDYERRTEKILSAFQKEHDRFNFDYKIVIGRSIEDISRKNEYVSFIRSIHRGMEENTVHRVQPQDVEQFNQIEYILREMEDICRKHDLDDPRVLAYCQPVYNIRTGKYDTAEALMRLQLKDDTLVPPNRFIPLAEENGYIHTLTEIILHKSCEEIKWLLNAGYDVTRISVNVSAMELKENRFCDDVMRIIERNGVPGDRVAIELTESRSESDFILMKEKILELREKGIKFYLDDFGTGYSNMERILELPFDIIKFDRSMVLASGASERSRKIVVSMANMFSELNYSVLYEGVEQDSDEAMCMAMSASYLQGYKYARPVPIVALKDYFERPAS